MVFSEIEDKKIITTLVDRIKNKRTNPFTNKEFCLEDIKIQEFKDAVQVELNA